jgi:hypothetical protein
VARISSLALVVFLVLTFFVNAQAAPRRGEAKMNKNVLRSLEKIESHVHRFLRKPSFRRYSRLVRNAEEDLQKLRIFGPKNMSFFLAAERAFRSYNSALESWRKAEDEDPRDYHMDIRNYHWKQAAQDLSRARSHF